jgi:RNA-binding protein 5/10
MNSSVDASMNPLPGNTVLPSFFPFLDHSQDLAADDLIVKALGGGSSSISSHANQDAKKKKIAISLRKSTEPSHSNTDEENKSVDASSQSIEVQSMNVKDPDPTAESIISSQLLKRHDADIAKWSQRGREMKNEHGAFAESVVVSKEIFRTPSGQPICLICKRKFASDEKLRQHEQLSDLHKQNLTKQSVVEPVMSGQDVQASVVMEYRDRASERRVLYPESHSLSVPSSTTLPSAHTSGVQEMIHPSQILNEEHIGNKMLQKMGWMGGSLGKANDDDSDPSDRKMSSKLREDWDRIESIASKRS